MAVPASGALVYSSPTCGLGAADLFELEFRRFVRIRVHHRHEGDGNAGRVGIQRAVTRPETE